MLFSRRTGITTLACAATAVMLTAGCSESTHSDTIDPADPLPPGSIAVTIDASRLYQTIEGFGTTERLFDDPHITETFNATTQRAGVVVPPAEQAKILDALYVDLGLVRVRYNARDDQGADPGLEPVNDNLDPNVTDLSRFDFAWKKNDGHIDYVKAARARGVTTWFVSPLTLETWMTEANPAEYVEWAMAILRRWRDRGVEMPYYSILNEPGYVRSGNRSGAWMRDVIKLLGATLAAEGFNTKIVAPDDLNATQAYLRLQTILADPGAAKHVGAIA